MKEELETKLNIAMNRNIIAYDVDAMTGDITGNLISIAEECLDSSRKLLSINVGDEINRYYSSNGGLLPSNKRSVALFTFVNGEVMFAAY